jgi:hypothetical protein
MTYDRQYSVLRWIAAVALVPVVTGCATYVRVPLAVPLPPVGGSRPAGPQGIHLVSAFGDGVWGQEQERAEMLGGGLGFSLRDRVEVLGFGYGSTRTVTDSLGEEHSGETTSGILGKLRVLDFFDGRASMAIHAGLMGADRTRHEVQNEHLSALDLAVPVELYPLSGPLVDYRFSIFAGPRMVIQTFEDRDARTTTRGVMLGVVGGLVGRWRHFALSGELNLVKTPEMTFGGERLGGGVHVLPMLGVRGIIPIGS